MQNDSPRFLQGYNICVCIVSFVVCNLGSLDKIWCGGVGQWDQRVSEMLGGRTRTVHFMRGWVAQETSCWRKIAWHTLYGAHVEWDVRYKWIIDNVFPPPSQKACVHSSERWNLKMEKMELLLYTYGKVESFSGINKFWEVCELCMYRPNDLYLPLYVYKKHAIETESCKPLNQSMEGNVENYRIQHDSPHDSWAFCLCKWITSHQCCGKISLGLLSGTSLV